MLVCVWYVCMLVVVCVFALVCWPVCPLLYVVGMCVWFDMLVCVGMCVLCCMLLVCVFGLVCWCVLMCVMCLHLDICRCLDWCVGV